VTDKVPYKVPKALSDGCHEVSGKSDWISKDEAKCGLAFVDNAVDSLSRHSYEMQGTFQGELFKFRSTLIDEDLDATERASEDPF
jgi:hypothetical protein